MESKCQLLQQCGMVLEQARKQGPLVHHITNYVTANDCANISLAAGASPLMADAEEEAAVIAAASAALVLNMGTVNARTAKAMLAAGKSANAHQVPVVFDPVGAGASPYRSQTAKQVIKGVRLAVLRGNRAEASILAGQPAASKGADAVGGDLPGAFGQVLEHAKGLARMLGCTVVVTGAEDIATDGETSYVVSNGHPFLSRVTGTGCMLTSLIGVFCATGATPLAASATALFCMGIAGEEAFEIAGHAGNGSYRVALLDRISCIGPETLAQKGKYHEITG